MTAAADPCFVDCHCHFQLEHFDDFVGNFDELGLCGAWDILHDPSFHHGATEDDFLALLDRVRRDCPDKVHIIWWPHYKNLTEADFPARTAKRIGELRERGIVGLKVWKDLGLGLKDPQGKLMMLDDERLNPIWEKLIELKLVLTAHVADPATFWLPLDESNPSYEMLKKRPDWHFGKPGLPTREQLYEARDRLHKRYPELTIVNSHFGGYAPSIDQLGQWMDEMPNFYATFGRHVMKEDDDAVGRFLERHADRIMFETDLGMRRGRKVDHPWNKENYAKTLSGVRQKIGQHGDDVLRKYAHENAERLMAEVGKS